MESGYTLSFDLLKTLQAKQEAFFFREALDLYIPPQVGRYVGDDKPQDAAQAIGRWLTDPEKQCLLLLGDSGVGKTLFGQWLTRQGFQNQSYSRIPLFIPLLAQNNPNKNLIDNYLTITCGIETEHQRDLIKQQPLLLIFDGFDEIHQKVNLYRSNQLWQFKDVKILISCRSQALENIYDYRALFYPCDSQGKPQRHQLQEQMINPFTEKQIDAYLQQYVSIHQEDIKVSHPDWLEWKTFQAAIKKLSGLQALLNSPFVLSMVVQILPSILTKHKDQESITQLHLARINLYDYFIERWFARQKQKLLSAKHISDNCPIEDLFAKCSKSIANAMLQARVNSIELTSHKIVPLLGKQSFFTNAQSDEIDDVKMQLKYFDEGIDVNREKIKLSLILSGCPVMQIQKNQYAFLHKSLLEYFAARKLFEGVMVNASTALGYELNENLLVDKPATLHFLAERVKQDDALKTRLFDVLEESKVDERIEIAAANAITILNYAGVSFAQKDLRRIRIKGADLSHAILDSTILKDSDLREVALKGAWLNNAKLGGALMQKAQFGEVAYLEAEEEIFCIAYAPDGRFLAAGSKRGIKLFEIATGKCVVALKDHTNEVRSLAFSSDGSRLVLGGNDKSVRLWDVKSQKCVSVFQGHTHTVTSVAFSSDGQLLASGSWDKTVRFWCVQSQKCLGVLESTNIVWSVAFSPDGRYLASGDTDKTVRLWCVQSQKCLGVLKSSNIVSSVAFSPDGRYLASGDADKTVRLWDVKNQNCLSVFQGHTDFVLAVAFSPDGYSLASGSHDKSVRLWDVKNQNCLSVFQGHTGSVLAVAFSPDGYSLASGSKDKSVRFWNSKSQIASSVLNDKGDLIRDAIFNLEGDYTGEDILMIFWVPPHNVKLAVSLDGGYLASRSDNSISDNNSVYLWNRKDQKYLGVLKGHTASVESAAFSPDGRYLASGSRDASLRLWDVRSKICLGVMEGHTNWVCCVTFSLDGSYLASGGRDNSVRFWDVKTLHCLNVLKLTQSVSDLRFKRAAENIHLYVDSDRAIYVFEIRRTPSGLDFILVKSMGYEAGLMSARLDLGGVIGLEPQNERLLKQREAVGTLSTKETDAVLKARSWPMPYTSKQSRYDLFSGQHLIMPNQAMVSMVRKKDSPHTFLVIECIQDNYYVITRADFVIDKREKHAIGKIISTGQALIEICVKPLNDMRELAEQCVYRSWKITGDQLDALFANLEADRLKRIHYLNLGNQSFYNTSSEETHNCLTWCEAHLSKIDIDIFQQQSWFDTIAAHPSSRLPDKRSASHTTENISTLPEESQRSEKEPDSKENCWMM